MSCGGPHQTPCEEIMAAMLLFLDNEIADGNQLQAVKVHLQECPPCEGVIANERAGLELLQSLLNRSCCETAPEELFAKIFDQTQMLADQMIAMHNSQFIGQTQFFAEYSRTEITVDGVTQIIETSHEIRRDFPIE
ncbi:MAG: zf-HC2 domain-containing protein [Actinomycetes bacterium]|jgi:mycothiol system anti-sigma-R factor